MYSPYDHVCILYYLDLVKNMETSAIIVTFRYYKLFFFFEHTGKLIYKSIIIPEWDMAPLNENNLFLNRYVNLWASPNLIL